MKTKLRELMDCSIITYPTDYFKANEEIELYIHNKYDDDIYNCLIIKGVTIKTKQFERIIYAGQFVNFLFSHKLVKLLTKTINTDFINHKIIIKRDEKNNYALLEHSKAELQLVIKNETD
jgi:hypothetical protein